MTTITARPSHAAAVRLLEQANLPTADLTDERLADFYFAGDADALLGIVGLELWPPHALLRSLAVDGQSRSAGLGSALLAHAEARARDRGVRSLYLLTTTAEPFFRTRGFMRAERGEAPECIRSSSEFAALCPASAAFMVKQLQD